MKNGILRVTANQTGPVRRERLMGREYRVVPARLVQSQVLNNNLGRTFLPAEDITPGWAASANNAPVVIGGHPRTSARDPEVLNRTGGGFLFRTSAGDGVLNADVFLDEELLAEIPGGEKIIKKLDEGEPVGLSTGFPVQIEEKTGVHNGKNFDRIIHPAGFDHLAVFTDLTGACSIEDGCALGLNEDSAVEVEEPTPEPGDDEGDATNEEKTMLKQAMTLLRKIVGLDSENRSAMDTRRLLSDAVEREHGSDEAHTFVEDFDPEEGVVIFEIMGAGDASGLFRSSFVLEEDGTVELGEPERVRRVTTFEPVADEGEAGNTSREEGMNRDELIARLAEEGPLDADALAQLSDCQLLALSTAGDEPEAGSGSGDDAGDGNAGNAGDGGDGDALSQILARLDSFDERITALSEATEPAVAERERERQALVAELAGNERVPFDKAELDAKNFEELRKLRSMARGENYAGLGGPRTGTVPDTSLNEDDLYLEPKPYHETADSGSAANGKQPAAAGSAADGEG